MLRNMLPASGWNATAAGQPTNFLRLPPLGWRKVGGKMIVTQATPQQVENVRVAVILLAIAIAVFWRIAVRILLAIAIIAIVTGALVLLQSMPR